MIKPLNNNKKKTYNSGRTSLGRQQYNNKQINKKLEACN